jgi:hypothetical protein
MDLLGAFAEKALSGSDSAPVLGHLAHCGDCREIVFLASPEIAGTGTVGSPTNLPSRARWISWPVFRWGTVAACAVIVVAAMRLHPSYHGNQTAETVAASHNLQASPKDVIEMPSPAQQQNPKIFAVEPKPEPAPGRRLDDIPGKSKAVPDILNQDSFEQQMTLDTDAMRNSPRWTLAADGTLQRSLDGGISWKQIHVEHDRVFRSVAAAGRSIWLGGQRGVLFHSTDAGQHWAQMKPTAEKPLPDSDIIGIEFDDEFHGKLTTARAESWTTSDAGQSWEKQ